MNRFLLVTISIAVAACATPSVEPDRSKSVQAMESGGDELLEQNIPTENFEGIQEFEAPNASKTPAEMMPHFRMAETEPEIVCDRVVPTGSILPVKVCRRRSEIERKTEADQELFDDIKRNTAIGTSRL